MTSSWRARPVTVELATPVHCGDLPLGFISRTQPYVPGHVAWFAMVPAAVRLLSLPPHEDSSYKRIEDFFMACLRISPFFVADEEQPLFPWDPEAREKLESTFLASQHGVALDYGNRSALENRLFEVEYILPKVQNEHGQTRYTSLGGYVVYTPCSQGELSLDESGRLNGVALETLLGASQWGGERNKGFGCLKKVNLEEHCQTCWKGALQNGDTPALSWPAATPCPFPLQWREELVDCVVGTPAPSTGRRHDHDKGPGQKMDTTAVVWQPGWIAREGLQLRWEGIRSLVAHSQ